MGPKRPPILPQDPLGKGEERSCTLGWNFELFKGRNSVILGVWAAPGAPETLPKGGGPRPPPFARVSGAPGAAQTPKMTNFRSLICLIKLYSHPVLVRDGWPSLGVVVKRKTRIKPNQTHNIKLYSHPKSFPKEESQTPNTDDFRSAP